MKQFKWVLCISVFLFSSILFSSTNDWNIDIEKLTPEESTELKNQSPRANPDNYISAHIRYLDNKAQFFIHTDNPTTAKYNQLLTCGDIDYPTIMLQTDAGYEKASLLVTLIINRLYIFDPSLSLVNSFESIYYSEEDDRSFRLKKQHIFTLDNVEEYACDYIKTLR